MAAVENSLVETIASAEKSVVAVARVRKEQGADSVRLEFRPDPFGRKPLPTDPSFVPNEYGAGVVVDRRGLILTANHVLGDENDSYYITASDRRVYRAWIKAANPRSDLAVLTVNGADVASANMVPIRMGDATALRKGQIVVTLGNPYAIARDGQSSAGWGIVSNLGRKASPLPDETEPSGKTTLYHFGGLIQTDARLHLGTSGGPLLNLRGEMIGLCIASAAMAGYESSAGYAIPVDATFLRVLDALKQGREAEYGFLGIWPANLKPAEIAAGLQGIRARVMAGTPAARAGLREDDIVTSVNGAAIYDTDGLVLEIGRLPVEAVAHLAVVRNGARQTIERRAEQVRRPRAEGGHRPARGVARRAGRLRLGLPRARPAAAHRTSRDRRRGSGVQRRSEHARRGGGHEARHAHQSRGWPARADAQGICAAIADKSGKVRLQLMGSDPANSELVLPPGS